MVDLELTQAEIEQYINEYDKCTILDPDENGEVWVESPDGICREVYDDAYEWLVDGFPIGMLGNEPLTDEEYNLLYDYVLADAYINGIYLNCDNLDEVIDYYINKSKGERTTINVGGDNVRFENLTDKKLPKDIKKLLKCGWSKIRDNADEVYDCGDIDEIFVFYIDEGIKLFVARVFGSVGVTMTPDNIKDFLYSFDLDSDSDMDEFVASWSVAPDLKKVNEDYKGECRVWHYAQRTNGKENLSYSQYAKYNGEEIIIFDSYAEAKKYLDDYNDKDFYCANGVFDRDILTIVEA